jgi:D-alanyl-D-alanine carboxypeptidase
LQEAGKLNINDPLLKYLPDYAAALPFGDQMTLRQLATHTSGVFDYTDNAPNGAPGIMESSLTDSEALTRGYGSDELIQFVIVNGQPNFEPGAEGQWLYSNTGYVLLGIIIERITGQALADVFRERIFEPLGMNDTFLWNDVPKPEFGLPFSYFESPFDLETTTWNMSQGWAAGGVISTAEDMTIFMRALRNGELFQNESTLAVMSDGVGAKGSFVQYGIGLGEKLPGIWGHGGQTLGFESDTGYVLENDVTIVVWTNAANDEAAVGAALIDQVLVSAGVVVDPNQVAVEAMTSQLRGKKWQWQELQILTQGGATTSIPNPENYTLLFNEDGTFNLQADCNLGKGSFSLDGLKITLATGPMTLAACSPESLSDQYLQGLGMIASFSIDDTDLLLVGTLDDTTFMMRFVPSGAAIATEPVFP